MISVVRKTDCLWLPVPLIFAMQVHKVITGALLRLCLRPDSRKRQYDGIQEFLSWFS